MKEMRNLWQRVFSNPRDREKEVLPRVGLDEVGYIRQLDWDKTKISLKDVVNSRLRKMKGSHGGEREYLDDILTEVGEIAKEREGEEVSQVIVGIVILHDAVANILIKSGQKVDLSDVASVDQAIAAYREKKKIEQGL